MLPVKMDVQVTQKRKNSCHYQQQQADQLGAEAVRQPFPAPSI
jgi:hypothetical protein